MDEFNLVITGFGAEGSRIAERIISQGVEGLKYLNNNLKTEVSRNVICLNSYRNRKQQDYHIAIIVITEKDIDEHLESIIHIRNQSRITLVIVTDTPKVDLCTNQRLCNLRKQVDTVFPLSDSENLFEHAYGTVRALIEAFTVQSITGFDITDISYIVRGAGTGITVKFEVPKDGNITEHLEKHIFSRLTRHQLLNAHGALISTTGNSMGMHDLQFSTEFLNENSGFNINCVINLLENPGESSNNSREITVVITGVCIKNLILY